MHAVAHPVVHGISDSTNSETILPVLSETSGGVLSAVDMVVQRRNGHRRLRDYRERKCAENYINNTINLCFKTAISSLLISNHNSFRVLFHKIALVYFI